MDKHPFADRIEEAHTLYELSKGSPHEEICWAYYEAVLALAKIAGGMRRRAFVRSIPDFPATILAAQ